MEKYKKYEAMGEARGKALGEAKGGLIANIKAVDKIVNAGKATLDEALELIGITKEQYESMLVKQ